MKNVNYEIKGQLNLLFENFRITQNLTIEEVSEKSQVSYFILKKMEKGCNFGWKQYSRLANFYNKDVQVELVERDRF